MGLSSGSRLGDYEIRSLLGAGGMGEVYRARDTRLKREVAIKVLHASVSGNEDRLRRFQLEAEAAAALNHPNILSIFDIGRQNGSPYIVTELLDGETLRERLRRGPVPLREALDLAAQIAHGLAAAHAAGIVHRDLKPENIFVTAGGRIKILDFGLAKFAEERFSPANDGTTATVRTDPGVVMGTVGYMSPEQVRGVPADHRADVFAFGVILYEMLSGKRAFQKATSAETMSAILNEQPPDISQDVAAIPPALERVMHRCLAKNPEQRFQSASDLAFAVEALSDSGSQTGVRSAPVPRRRAAWITAVAGALAICAGLVVWWRMPAAAPKVLGFTQLTDDGEPKHGPLATDGARIYFTEGGPGSYAVMQVASSGGQTAPVPIGLTGARSLGIVPGNSALLVETGAIDLPGGPLWLAPLPAGAPRRVGDISANGAAMAPDGRVVFSQGSRIFSAEKDGSGVRKLYGPDTAGSAQRSGCILGDPRPSPDARHVAFSEFCSVPSLRLRVVSLASGAVADIPAAPRAQPCCAAWTSDGRYLLFQAVNGGRTDLWAVKQGSAFSRQQQPIRLTNGPLSFSDAVASPDPKQIFAIGSKLRGELVRYDEKTGQFVPYLSGMSANDVTFSRDGKWIAYRAWPESTLWRSRSDGSERQQLTWPPTVIWYPFISPDGTQVAYVTEEGMYIIGTDGRPPRRIGDNSCASGEWSPDGQMFALNCIADRNIVDQPNMVEIRLVDLKSGTTSVLAGSKGMIGPFWIDQHTLLAATADATRFMIYDFRTNRWSTLATGEFVNWFATPDGKYVVCTTRGADPEALRIRTADGKVQRITSLRGLRRVVDSYTNTQVNVTPDGSLLFTRDIGTQEIYALDVKW